MKPRINPFLPIAALATVLTFFTGSSLAASITYVWEGNTSGDLTDGTNWVGGTAPAATGDAIQFGAAGSAGTSLALNTGMNVGYTGIVGGALQFNAGAPSYTISGSGLITLSTGTIVNNSGFLQVINNNLKRNTGNSITIGANGGILEFNGTYDIAASNLTQMTFGSTVGGVIAFNGGLINPSGGAGPFGLTMPSNAGTVALGGANTVLNGTVALGASSTLKLTSAGAINSGQNISTPNASNDTLWLASDTAVNNFNITTATSLLNKHNLILGTGSSGTAVTNQQIGTFAITSQNGYYFSKAGNVTSGTPVAEITGTASFTNTATTGGAGRSHIISANGVDLIFSNTTAFNYVTAPLYHAALVLDGNTSGSKITGTIIDSDVGVVVLTKAGAGTWTLSGSNKYEGVTAVNNGTLKLDFNATGAPNGDGSTTGNILYNNVTAATVTLGGGNLWVAGKDGTSSTQALGAMAAAGNTGGSTITLRAGSGGSTVLNVTGLAVNTASSVNFDLGAGTTFNNAGATANSFVASTAYYGGNEFARYDGSKNVVAAVDGNYNSALAATGTGSTSGYYRLDGSLTRDPSINFSYKGLRLSNTGDSDILDLNGGTLTYSNSGMIYKGGSNNQYAINNGTILGNAVATDFNVVSGATLTINAAMANNTGAAAFTKSGAGTVKIAGAKTFTGRVSLFDGVYEVDSIANGGQPVSYTNASGVNTITVTSAAGLSIGQFIQGSGIPTGTTITNISGTTVTLSGNTTAANGSATSGSAYTSANYNGLGASSSASASLYLYGGTLKYTGSGGSTDRSFTVGSRGAVIDASGSGALTWAPAVALAYGYVDNQIGNTDTGASQDQLFTFTGASTADNTFGSALGLIADQSVGRTFVTKSGTGKWIFNQANTYTGGTKINGGTLGITNANALGTVGAISFGGGTLQYGSGITQDLSHRIQHSIGAIGIDTYGNNVTFQSRLDETNTGGLTKAGSGTLTLANSNLYTGNTTVSAGTLILGNGTNNSSLSDAGEVIIAASATLNLNYRFSNTDTINKLTINGVQKAAGVWGGIGSGAANTDSQITGTGTLTVLTGPAGGNDYSTWATDNGITGQPFNGDYDNDGISNGVEYALGKNPTVSSQPPGVLSGNTITFAKGADAIANDDVSWIIETSETLAAGSWTAEVTQLATDNSADISYTFTPGTPAKKFARLKVVQVP